MEPFERDEFPDGELDAMLQQWRAPRVPQRMRQALFPRLSQPWWRRLWSVSFRLPLPVACALLLVLAAGVSFWPRMAPAPRIIVKTERVEIPVVQERIVYRDRNRQSPLVWKPVAELRPRIIRSRNDQN